MGAKPSSQSPLQVQIGSNSNQELGKISYQSFPLLSNFARFSTFDHISFPVLF